ncbi:MAG: phosphoglycerate dehydrogenase [Bacteroidetes bacterium]|nr:phosphoglycerate dehydrogenase [Bacteroidota bacterium]
MKILVSDALEQSVVDVLTGEGFEVDHKPGMSPAELKNVIGEYDGLVVRSSTKVNAELISFAGKMKVIGRAGTGVDNIDVEAATRAGILVMNTPGGNTISAAEHTVSMLLSLARNIPQAHMSLTKGEWDRKRFIGTEVFEKTLGVIGLGKIGREVALRCQGFGMKTIGYDPVLSSDVAMKLNIELVTLDELYRRSDFITVHTPLSAETKGLLNDATLAQCKRGVRIINCARGGIVDEQALHRALVSGRVAGAALDVFEVEPPKNNPLLSHERVIATPHLGASTEEAQEKVAVQIAHQIADALHGRGYSGLVNGAALQFSIKDEVKPFLTLAEKMGSLVAQLATGKIKHLTVVASGDLVVSSLELMKAGILKGILSHLYPDPVNFINAPILANEMGLVVGEQRGITGENFTNLLGFRYKTEKETKEVAGTVFGSSTIRLVKLDSFRFEVRPEGFLLIYNNIDKPGMLARVGLILAKHNVNIAGVSLGRGSIGENALTVMNIDSDIPEGGMVELQAEEGLSNLKLVRLD